MFAALALLVPAASRGATLTLGGRTFLPLKRATARQYDTTLHLKPVAGVAARFSVLFAYGADGYYEAAVSEGGVRLARVLRGGRRVLSAGRLDPAAGPLRRILLRRLRDRLVVVVNDAVVCRAIDSHRSGGWILVEQAPGAPAVEKTVVRVRTPILFTDGFMVTQDEETMDRGWRRLAGAWRCRTIRPEPVAQRPAYRMRSANAFAYLGVPPAGGVFALSATGEEWWSDYRCRASLKCLAPGAAGLAFGCEGPMRFWVVRLVCRRAFERPARLQLIRVDGGRREPIREVWVRARVGRWYAVAAEVGDGRVRVSFQGATVMDVADARITGGPVGLYAEGVKGAVFDDVEVGKLDRIRFDRAEELAAFGEQRDGSWRVRMPDGGPPETSPADGDGQIVFGDETWAGGAVTAEVRPGRRGTFGIVAGANGGGMILLALTADGVGALLHQHGGGTTILERFEHDARRGEWCRIGLNLSDPGVVSGYVGEGLVVRVHVKDRPRGRVGLFAEGAPGVAFRGLVANRSPRLLAEHQIGNAVFLSDAYMSSWATEQGQWIPDDGVDRARSMSGYGFHGKNVFWRKGDYYGDYVMILPLTIESKPPAQPGGTQPPSVHTPVEGPLSLHFCLRSGDLESGYRVTATATAPGVYHVVLARGKQTLAEAADVRVGEGGHEVRIYHSGAYVWARVGGRELFSHRAVAPPAGTRIAAVRNGTVDFDRLAVYAENVDDSSFERAPTHWRVVGDWHVVKRFMCDPRWSWMGVDSRSGSASLWHRREFPGDATVELYASMKMRRQQPYYCPSDLNITLSADRESPASGYTFLVGGWKNSKTAILRNGKVVAETDEPYLPDTRDRSPSSAMLHRRWFYVKVRRRGPTVELYLDNKKYLEYTDPDPLPGGKLGVWTQEQGIMVARVVVHYSRSVRPTQTVAPGAPEPAPTAAPLAVIRPGEPGGFFDFESGAQGWDAADDADGAMAVVDSSTAPSGGGRASLRLVNARSPGRFLARIPVPPVNLLACPELSFDYRIPAGVRVNLYFDVPAVGPVAARTWFVALTGPDDSTEAIKRAGRFADARADGRWRTARIGIAALMRRFYPTARTLLAKHFRLGLDHRGTYAVSGLGGNPRGATWHIDNFCLVPAAAGKVVLRWRPLPARHAGYAACVADRADVDPGDEPNLAAPYLVLEPKGPERRFLHVRPTVTRGRHVAPAAHVPFCSVGPALDVLGIEPADRAAWGGEPIRIRLRASQLAALDVGSVKATLGPASARLDGGALRMDWDRAELVLDARALPAAFDDGAVVNGSVSLRAFGQAEPTELAWQYVASSARDRTPPGPVLIKGHEPADDFETDWQGWRLGDQVIGGLDDATAAGGRRSLRIVNRSDGGSMIAYRSVGRRVVGAWPILEFDYRAGPLVRTDLVLSSSGPGTSVFQFLDRTSRPRVGSIPDVKADGKWHHATVDLAGAFWRSNAAALSGRLNWVGFGDMGWPSAREGDTLHLDNFQMVPVVSCRDGLELTWKASDPLGVAGYAFRWSDRADDEPPKQMMTTEGGKRFERLAEGRTWFHVRAVDRAGNWGPTTHVAFLVDNTPPDVSRLYPRPGTRTVPYRLTVSAPDAHGPDPATLKLVVGKRTFTVRSPTRVGARQKYFSWDLTRDPEAIAPIPNGAKVPFSLTGVRDFAGNTAAPVEGFWTMDYSRDRTVPQRVEFDPASAKVALLCRFDRGLDGARAGRHCRVSRVLSADAASHALLVTPTASRSYHVVLKHAPIDLAETGIVKVDVKFPRGRGGDLDLMVIGRGFRVRLPMGGAPPKEVADDGKTYVSLGSMNGIGASGEWHTQWVDLYARVKKAFPGLESYKLTNLGFGRMAPPYGGRGVRLDNVMVYGRGSGEMTLGLRSRDLTGLSGYAVEVAPAASATMPRKVNHTGDELTRTLGPGVWYVTAVACDGNGNWSRVPGVLPYVVAAEPAVAP